MLFLYDPCTSIVLKSCVLFRDKDGDFVAVRPDDVTEFQIAHPEARKIGMNFEHGPHPFVAVKYTEDDYVIEYSNLFYEAAHNADVLVPDSIYKEFKLAFPDFIDRSEEVDPDD